MTVLIENEQLRALISEHGAELTSLVERTVLANICGTGMPSIGSAMLQCYSRLKEN